MPPRMLLGLSVSASLAYFVTIPWHPFPGSVVLKGLSVAPLAVLAFVSGAPLLGAGLAFGSLGDVLLDLQPSLFVFGLGAFLVGHLIYIAAFRRLWPGGPAPARERIRMLAVVAFSAAFVMLLWRGLGDQAIPVALYIAAITAMVLAAIRTRLPEPWLAAGAILFLFSDAVLGLNRFRGPVPYRDWIVWSTYYLGQVGIALGYLRAIRGHSRV